VISEYTFGESAGALESPDMGKPMNETVRNGNKIHPFGRTFRTLLHYLSRLPRWAMPDSKTMRARDDFTALIGSLTQKAWDRTKAASDYEKSDEVASDNRNVMRSLIGSNDLPPSERTLERTGGEAVILIGAGTETTGRTLAVILYHILANRQTFDRLLEELRSVMSTSHSPLPAAVVLENLPFLTAVISEGMRMAHGVAGRLVRIAPDEDLQYGKYKIPRGATFSQSQYAYHTNGKNFPDPFSFKPERFLGPDASKAYKNFAPFGRGSRACVGLNLAYSEMYLTVAALIAGVKMELVETTERDATIVSTRSHSLGCEDKITG